ncbi:hypothetical protein [Halobellus ruber]|uniref:DUF7968 domain-containing protein n=1 Tax=Halobellus ruber TaxID=2761102 RepID=A0A7J9SJE9_9EURY|nr:hypothetical protein [Halobellus ruber]MBB6645131.1 hypothetical protein [Halobellus ruber]
MTADTVRLSYLPAEDRIADGVDAEPFRSYLRRAHRGRVEPGAEWSAFVGRGCGVTGDVTLRVEAVTGGSSIGADTAFVFEPRADADTSLSP